MRKETMKEMAANMKAAGFEPMGMNAAKEKLQRHLDGGIADARDRLRSSAQCEATVLALNDLLNETQKKAMLLVADNDRLRAANARLQAWHDAVVAARVVDAVDVGTAAMVLRQANGRILELQDAVDEIERRSVKAIIRPQPLAKE